LKLKEINLNLIPTYDHIILKQNEAENKTASGILLAGSTADTGIRAEVVAVGKGRLLQDGTVCKLSVYVGDTVVLGHHAEYQEELSEGERYLIVRESSIVAIEAKA